MMPRLEIYRSRSLRLSQRWRWRLRAVNGQVIAESGEGYASREHADHMGRKVIAGAYANAEVIW